MIEIQVGVGIFHKPFILIDKDDDEEVGTVIGTIVSYVLERVREERELSKMHESESTSEEVGQ